MRSLRAVCSPYAMYDVRVAGREEYRGPLSRPGAVLINSIKTKEQLALALQVSFQKHLVYYLYRLPDTAKYRPFQIRKRSGGHRTIHAPHLGLKVVQRRLAKMLAENYGKRGGVHGFIADRGIITNARNHVRKRFVLNIDLKDFFKSINYGRVRGLLMSPMYSANEEVATVIAQLCCFENSLPQGAPTSPVISNMICGKLDADLKGLARELGCTYTRYCDDITLSCDRAHFPPQLAVVHGSGEERQVLLGERLTSAIAKHGFEINARKTRLLSQSDRQEVTGLTVNRFPNIPRKYIRNLRAVLHAWRKFGLDAVSAKFSSDYETRTRDKADFQSVIFGRIQHVGAVRGFDDEIYRKLRIAYNLLGTQSIPLHENSREFTLENAIWVFECTFKKLEGGKPIEDCNQGTAFFLENVGIVTCAHCIGERNYIYHPTNPAQQLEVELLAKSDDIDLAVLKLTDSSFQPIAAFKSGNDSNAVQRGEKVVLAGFPSFGPGSQLSVKDGNIQSIKNKSGIRRFNISAPIIAGNSGGPVFNIRGQVIGVAVTGADSIFEAEKTEAHGVIPIAALEHLKPG